MPRSIIAAGNALTNDASDTWVMDTTAPTASVTAVSPDPRNTAVGGIEIVFSEAATGLLINDTDGVVRRIPLLVRYSHPILGDNIYPSISLCHVLAHLGLTMRDLRVRFGEAIEFDSGNPLVTTRIPINEHGEMLINFREGEAFTERGISTEVIWHVAERLIAEEGQGTRSDRFEIYGREIRRGEQAFVGLTASGLSGTYLCPPCVEARREPDAAP